MPGDRCGQAAAYHEPQISASRLDTLCAWLSTAATSTEWAGSTMTAIVDVDSRDACRAIHCPFVSRSSSGPAKRPRVEQRNLMMRPVQTFLPTRLSGTPVSC